MAVIQRPVKGSRISSFYPVHDLPPLASLDSAFQLQEYISLLIRLNVHDVDVIVSVPGKNGSHERGSSDSSVDKDSADKEGKSEVTVDESCWVYEQLRRLAQDLSHPLITTLQQECTRQTCPEMKAGEWLYLCVAHGNEGAMEQCCAIDYILHTLDSATALLNSPRAFPSRLSIPPASTRHFSSLARRLGRIFAHAYYHHREAFEQAEAESSLYARFLALTSKFSLVPTEFLVIPPRMSIQMHTRDEDERDDSSEESDEPIDLDPSEFMNTARRIHGQERLWLQPDSDIVRGVSPPGPAGDARMPSPRKGRSRTDTMVHSEAINVAEELAKGHVPEAELEKEVAQERLIAYEPYGAAAEYPPSQPQSSQKIQFEEIPAPQSPEVTSLELPEQDSVPTEASSEPAPAAESVEEVTKETAANMTEKEMNDAIFEMLDKMETEEPTHTEETVSESIQEIDVTESVEHSEPTPEDAPSVEPVSEELPAEDTDNIEEDVNTDVVGAASDKDLEVSTEEETTTSEEEESGAEEPVPAVPEQTPAAHAETEPIESQQADMKVTHDLQSEPTPAGAEEADDVEEL